MRRLTPAQERQRIDQTAQALATINRQQEQLEKEAVQLIAHGEYIENNPEYKKLVADMEKALRISSEGKAERSASITDPGVKKAYEALEEEYAALHTMLDARLAAGLTQADVAKRMGTTVSAVSRLEASLRSEKHSPSYATLKKYAHACGKKLLVQMV